MDATTRKKVFGTLLKSRNFHLFVILFLLVVFWWQLITPFYAIIICSIATVFCLNFPIIRILPNDGEIPRTSSSASSGPGDQRKFDVLIIGTGMSGAIMAMILSKKGYSVLMVEGTTHPRFTLGESSIGETPMWWKILAARFELPELFYMSSAKGILKFIGLSHGLKDSFSYIYHREGKEFSNEETVQAVTFKGGPFGRDVHFYRQDTDYFLFQSALKYGAKALQGIAIKSAKTDLAEGVKLELVNGQIYTGEYLVDASGFGSVLARELNARETPCRLQNNTRVLFNHFIGLGKIEDIYPESQKGFDKPWSSGTLHHIFDGGWLWIIPFNNWEGCKNNVVSVGLCLDNLRHPKPTDISPEEEFDRFLKRFPSIAKQFANATTVREWASSERMQYSSTITCGDRWCMMPHAAGNVDALFSRGLHNTFELVNVLCTSLLSALEKPKSLGGARFAGSSESFTFLNKMMQDTLDANDLIISSAYIAFKDYSTMKTWMKVWFLGSVNAAIFKVRTYLRYMQTKDKKCLENPFHDAVRPGAIGPLTPGFSEWMTTASTIIRKVNDGVPPEKVARELHDVLKNLPFCPPIPFLRELETRKVNLNYPAFFPTLVLWGKFRSSSPKLYDFHPIFMLRLWVMTWFGPFKGQIY
jgi:FADH2 O2-dependent halogenase